VQPKPDQAGAVLKAREDELVDGDRRQTAKRNRKRVAMKDRNAD